MSYRVYSAEYKLAMINEFMSRNLSVRTFAAEKGIGLSTFESWLTKARKAGQIGYLKDRKSLQKPLAMMDVTNEVKTIIHEKQIPQINVFTLETKGMKLTFSIADLKTVLGVINHD